MKHSNKPNSKCSAKHLLKTVVLAVNLTVSTLNAQVGKILWGNFAKHPAKAVIERSPLLKEADVQVLILYKKAKPFGNSSLNSSAISLSVESHTFNLGLSKNIANIFRKR
ncbi:MAG: hypothetical protein AB1298_00455 [Bacteroidota bacterium]